MGEHWFWAALTIACVVWYSTITDLRRRQRRGRHQAHARPVEWGCEETPDSDKKDA